MMRWPLRDAHRASALVLLVFLLAHLANHMTLVAGVATHIAVMETLRVLYRHPLAEVLLLGCMAFQVTSGVLLAARGWNGHPGRVARLQALSGLYLAFFATVHVGAVLAGRAVLALDTNVHFAAAGLHVPPFGGFFAPYYALAVTALLAHLGCALHWALRTQHPLVAAAAPWTGLCAGAALGVLFVLAMAGAFEPYEPPAAYRAPYHGAVQALHPHR